MSQAFIVNTFYHFGQMGDLHPLRERLLKAMQLHDVKGTVTLAPEGINATITGLKQSVSAFMGVLREATGFPLYRSHTSSHTDIPFGKSKVKIKPQLISLGVPVDVTACVGTYVQPEDWNALITADDVITIDTRNDYEYDIGHFEGAVNPATDNFKEMVAFTKTQLNPNTHPRVAMYCTGGIRCEKYSSYLLTQGFKEVFHLKGGILAYLEKVPEAASLWCGDCYVFDDRIAVTHGLEANPDVSKCLGCGMPLYSKHRAHESFIEDVQCEYCADMKPHEKRQIKHG